MPQDVRCEACGAAWPEVDEDGYRLQINPVPGCEHCGARVCRACLTSHECPE